MSIHASSITGLYASMKAVKYAINSNKYDDGKAREIYTNYACGQ